MGLDVLVIDGCFFGLFSWFRFWVALCGVVFGAGLVILLSRGVILVLMRGGLRWVLLR